MGRFGKPVRCILDRETDMRVTGKRHFYLARQKIAFNDDGRLQALCMKVYVNAGNTLDVSMAVKLYSLKHYINNVLTFDINFLAH